MIGPHLAGIHPGQQGIDPPHRFDPPGFLHILDEMLIDLRQYPCVVAGPVMVEGRQLQMVGHRVQLVIFQPRIKGSADGHRIHGGKGVGQAAAPRRRPDKGGVKGGVVGHQHTAIPAKGVKRLQRFLFPRRIPDHIVVDAGQLGDLWRNRPPWIDKGVELLQNLAVFHPYRADFGQPVVLAA